MAEMFSVISPGRKYTDKEGNEKTNWIRCGVAWKAKKGEGFDIKLDSVPNGQTDDNGLVTITLMIREMEEREGSTGGGGKKKANSDDNDIGF